ncbi:MAG: membrane-bound PQQ-dependent dehydrogenase, glucose/quinate/shikimate family [Rubrivivax sp.]|nr:membrane-bound PQQ-dependent dehydrogenase, glucose/quinate/shikimate family [Rubrivivax sp.]
MNGQTWVPSAQTPGQRAVGIGMLAVLGLVALLLVAGGIWLLAVGGSPYYLVAGILVGATAVLLRRRVQAGIALYAVFFIGTLAWALWEAGLDWWPLAARLGVPFVLGALLLLPAVKRPFAPVSPAPAVRREASRVLAAGLLAFVAVAVASWLRDPWTIEGSLPQRTGTSAPTGEMPAGEWQAYGRTAFGRRYSPLTQITPDNVRRLVPAWTYHTGDVRGRPGDPEETTFEVTPLKVGNRLYLCTPHQSVVALDATSGKEVWRRNLKLRASLALQHLTCRGLSYYKADAPAASAVPVAPAASAASAASAVPTASAASSANGATAAAARACAERLFMPTADGRLVALDAASGENCSSFGNGSGEIDLWTHMPNVRPGAYYSTSPVVVTRRLVIVGGTVLDNASVHEQSGVIRAFDVDTGALVWNWDSARPEQTAPLTGEQTYTPNSPNSWSVSSVDESLGLLYVPMGNQPPDQWGGRRSPAVERYSSSIVALELATGRVRWVFQTVHHDLWDYDVPAQPVLVDLDVRGQTVQALVQATKQGEIFVLDRRTGEPVHPVTEVPAPQRAAGGDHTAATQPVSAISLAPPVLRERDMWGGTMFDQLMCRIAFRQLRYDGRFTPPTIGGSLVNPGNFGVFNWGSIAVDPVRGIAFTTPAILAFTSQLVPRPDATALMVQDSGPPQGSLPALNENFGAPFAARMKPFVSPFGVPCQEPPWGTVAGVDLVSGQIVWRHRNGTVRDLSPVPLPFKMGVPNLGGPIVTAGGVAFLSGPLDYYLRAYDVTTGRELWKHRLPAGAQATPMSYQGADGRQYVLVAAGGHGSTGTRPGDAVVAFALPAGTP